MTVTTRTTDRPRETRAERSAFYRVRMAERDYASRLRAVARQVNEFVRSAVRPGQPPDAATVAWIRVRLDEYAALLRPWAEKVAGRMIQDVQRRDEAAWKQHARRMSRGLLRELNTAPTGLTAAESLRRQIDLITSLPREAAERVQNLALTGFVHGRRAGEIRGSVPPEGLAKDILATGEVTVSRANLIARTETTRVATEILKARAAHVGSTHFIWHTAGDADVRPAHKKLNGRTFSWDEPPIAEISGQRHLPGAFPNCRCWAEPILPETIT